MGLLNDARPYFSTIQSMARMASTTYEGPRGGVFGCSAILDENDAGKATMVSRARFFRSGSVGGVPKLVATKSTLSLIS